MRSCWRMQRQLIGSSAAGLRSRSRIRHPHHRIRPSLRNIVKELGHEDLAYYI